MRKASEPKERTVIPFGTVAKRPRRDGGVQSGGGTILFFTGVRYERRPAPEPAIVAVGPDPVPELRA